MGWRGSGRYPTYPPEGQRALQQQRIETLRIRHRAKIAHANLKAILANAERELKKNPAYIPPPAVLDIHKYVIDRAEGKPGVQFEIKQETTLVLDPSRYLAALRDAQAAAAPYRLESDNPPKSGYLHNRPPDPLCLCPAAEEIAEHDHE